MRLLRTLASIWHSHSVHVNHTRLTYSSLGMMILKINHDCTCWITWVQTLSVLTVPMVMVPCSLCPFWIDITTSPPHQHAKRRSNCTRHVLMNCNVVSWLIFLFSLRKSSPKTASRSCPQSKPPLSAPKISPCPTHP